MLLSDLSKHQLLSLYSVSPALWLLLALGTTVATAWLAVRASPYAWVAASLLMFLGPPRVVLSYLAFLVVGLLAALPKRDESPKISNSGIGVAYGLREESDG